MARKPQQLKDFCVNGHSIAEVGRAPSNGSCNQCQRDSQRKRRLVQIAHLVRRARYDEALENNGGIEACAICGSKVSGKKNQVRLSVDHDHNTDAVRGLLCGLCNSGIGLLRDDLAILEKATEYLRRYSHGS